jgi:hypothetical protein
MSFAIKYSGDGVVEMRQCGKKLVDEYPITVGSICQLIFDKIIQISELNKPNNLLHLHIFFD